jgi:tRNA modification GTPase
VVERRVLLDSVAVTLLDTAGLREDPGTIEAEGLRLAAQLAAEADLWLVVVPAHQPDSAKEALRRAEGRPHLVVTNHADRAPATGPAGRAKGGLTTNARTGDGVPRLADAIAEALVGEQLGGEVVIASARQRDRLLDVHRHLLGCVQALDSAGPAVAAEELYSALERLDELSGRDTREEVLDRLFSRFCIGK